MKYLVELNGKKYEVEVEEGEARVLSESVAAPAAAPVAAPVAAPAPAAAPAAPVAPAVNVGSGTPVTSPMPGTVLELKCADGQSVKAGDTIVVLEAMKMENDIVAPVDGTIKYSSTKGSTVDTGAVLAVIV